MKRKSNLALKRPQTISTEEKIELLKRILVDRKAEEIVILDLRKLGPVADFFVICSARSTRHVQGIAEHLLEELERRQVPYRGVEGLAEGQWVLIDCDDVLIHIFYAPVRAHYDLEGLWSEAPLKRVSNSHSCEDQREDS